MELFFFNSCQMLQFTPQGWAITLDVIVEDWERNVKISVTISGLEFQRRSLENFFNCFYQAIQVRKSRY